MHMLVRHKVSDFAKWKPVYDAHLSARQKAGLKEEHLFRNADDPNEVLLLFSVEDVDKAKAFTASDRSTPGHGEGRSKRQAGRLFSQIAAAGLREVLQPVTRCCDSRFR